MRSVRDTFWPFILNAAIATFSISIATQGYCADKKVSPPIVISNEEMNKNLNEKKIHLDNLKKASDCPVEMPKGMQASDFDGRVELRLTSRLKAVGGVSVTAMIIGKYESIDLSETTNGSGVVVFRWGFHDTCGRVSKEILSFRVYGESYHVDLKSGGKYVFDIDQKGWE